MYMTYLEVFYLGYHRKTDRITLSQFVRDMTMRDEEHLHRCISPRWMFSIAELLVQFETLGACNLLQTGTEGPPILATSHLRCNLSTLQPSASCCRGVGKPFQHKLIKSSPGPAIGVLPSA